MLKNVREFVFENKKLYLCNVNIIKQIKEYETHSKRTHSRRDFSNQP